MNAYELAKEIEACFTKADWNVLEAATMLRQQADRIAELEKFIKAILKKGGCDGNICKRYDTHPVKQLTLDMIYKVSEATPINNEDDWFDTFAKNLIKEISND